MFPRADITGTRPTASVETLRPTVHVADAHQEVFQRLNQIAVGASFRAEILSRLNDGTFLVKVADASVRMNLPTEAQVGDTLDLTLMAKQPRLTFLMGTSAGENMTSLSNAGRLVDQVLHAAQSNSTQPTLIGKAPLLPSPDAPPAQLATALKDTLAFSGLFYESHVGQWANGERSLMDLMGEPQAKNSNLQSLSAALRAAASTGKAETNAPQIARLVMNLQGQPQSAGLLMNVLRAAAQLASNPSPPENQAAMKLSFINSSSAVNSSSVETSAPIDVQVPLPPLGAGLPTTSLLIDASMPAASAPADQPAEATTTATPANKHPATEVDAAPLPKTMSGESVHMINLQLNTLEQQRVVWQGELWPGQPIEWEISEELPHGKKTEAEPEERAWQSIVRFDMPVLGAVSASVRLTGQKLQIQVRAANEATASLLRTHGDALSSALDAAGSPLELLTVKRDESV
jgi:hypothetical protein